MFNKKYKNYGLTRHGIRISSSEEIWDELESTIKKSYEIDNQLKLYYFVLNIKNKLFKLLRLNFE